MTRSSKQIFFLDLDLDRNLLVFDLKDIYIIHLFAHIRFFSNNKYMSFIRYELWHKKNNQSLMI